MVEERAMARHMEKFLNGRVQKEDRGGHIVLESIMFSLPCKVGPQGV